VNDNNVIDCKPNKMLIDKFPTNKYSFGCTKPEELHYDKDTVPLFNTSTVRTYMCNTTDNFPAGTHPSPLLMFMKWMKMTLNSITMDQG